MITTVKYAFPGLSPGLTNSQFITQKEKLFVYNNNNNRQFAASRDYIARIKTDVED